MAKEGYLQIKLKDLSKKVEELDSQIESKLKEFQDAEIKIISNVNNAVKRLSPLLELENKLQSIQISALNNCEIQTNNKLESFEDKIKIQIDTYMKDNFKDIRKINFKNVEEIKEHLNELLENSIKTIDNDRKNDAARIDNIITILNKRGITNITSMTYNTKTGKTKSRKLKDDVILGSDVE